jgi:hypothetical protein
MIGEFRKLLALTLAVGVLKLLVLALGLALGMAFGLAGSETRHDEMPEVRPVRTVKVEPMLDSEIGSVALPASALASKDGEPAVWLVDPHKGMVELRVVTVSRYETGRVIISGGLGKDDIVVTAGANRLREGAPTPARADEKPATSLSSVPAAT